MAPFQNIKKQLLPLIKGLPIIIVVFIVSIFIAKKIIQYTPTMYLSVAKIKLDNQKFGASNSLLYKDFDVFTTEDKIETEAELLGSHLLIKKALDKVFFDVAVNRVGKIRNTSLYKNSPIKIDYDFIDSELFDLPFQLTISDQTLTLVYNYKGQPISVIGKLNRAFNINGNQITINKNDSLIKLKSLQLDGQYSFLIYSEEGLINKIKEQLDVKAIDKEMSVLRVVFKDEVPAKTADFNNALCEAYIEDYIGMKSYAANKTVSFIDLKLEEIGDDLAVAERELETYKMNNGVVNTRQETETGLRQVSNLKIQLVNTEMNEKAILELEKYIENGNFFDETAINFGFGDLLMTELVKKMKLWNDEKQDLLIKYKEGSDEINAVNNKIAEVKKYIKEAIKSNKREIIIKREKLEADIKILSTQFDDFPTREKDLQILEREFRLQESVFNFLSQKRIEAFIASTSATSFHRIIQPAYIPKLPGAPNKTLITFVCGLLGLIIGIAFVYIRQFARAKIMDKGDLERNSLLPIAGIIRHFSDEESTDFNSIVKTLLLKGELETNQIITVSSTLSKEGKTLVLSNIASVLKAMNYKVCIVDYNMYNYKLTSDTSLSLLNTNMEEMKNGTSFSVREDLELLHQRPNLFQEKLDDLVQYFDFVLIDTSATAISIEPVEAMRIADLNLFVVRSNFTATAHVSNVDLMVKEFGLRNVQLVLTDTHKASNYNGNLIGSRFEVKSRKKGIINMVKQYVNYYLIN